MSFKTFTSEENGIGLINLADETNGTLVSVVPQYGAMLHAFAIWGKDGLVNVIDNYSNIAAIQKELSLSYKSSKLSPFACRIADAKYVYDGETFELSNKFVDGTAIHGLLYNKAFAVVDVFADDEQSSVLLKYNYKEEDDGYPFSYRCEVKYTLLPQNVLQLQTTIISLDDLTIPMADGWHPYFKLGGSINNWLFYFNASAMIEFNEKLVPTGRLNGYNNFNEEKKIDETQLDNCFLLNEDETYAACTLRNPQNGLQISFFPDKNYRYLQVYTPPHRNSIAIENLSAAPDAFNNKMGLLMLPPRHTHTFTVHYQLGYE
jgi:aldose 1-epimerase